MGATSLDSPSETAMKPSLALLGALLGAAPATAMAQQCLPDEVSFGYSQPNNVAIADENALRWPTDASIRVAYGGTWCPDASQFTLVDEDGTEIPAQVRMRTPFNLVENAATPLTLIDIDPEPELEARQDYTVVVRPPNPSLPAFAEYTLDFRTSARPMQPVDGNAFAGVEQVKLFGDRCSDVSPFEPTNANNPACLVSSLLRLSVIYTPIDKPEISYVIYRTSSTPLDEAGAPIAAEADNTRIPVAFETGARDLLGTGISPRQTFVQVLYYPLPRRDCFSVLMLDEWGRERGNQDAIACIDLLPLAPCPDGCEGDECMFGFPEPNPFETNAPIPGQSCENLGLNGGDPDRPTPEVGEEPTGPGTDDAGVPDGGAGSGTEGGGGSDGCIATPGPTQGTPWLAVGLLGLLLGRRRRR
jgi:MYXO-CTERM domain-containing protein